MSTTEIDPYYSRKSVPKEFVDDVGFTGLSPEEEFKNREMKYKAKDGTDIRSHTPKAIAKPTDPYYSRKRVSNAEIVGVGETGLTQEQEFINRERKYSAVDGTDLRSHTPKWIATPGDPYYYKNQVTGAETVGVGELENDLTPAQQYETRERKQSLFQTSADPFANLAGKHRASAIDPAQVGAANMATERRRSSAVAPHAMHSAHESHGHHLSDSNKLAPIESKPELPPVSGMSETAASGTTAADSNTGAVNGGHTTFHDEATGPHGHDDDIGPHDTSNITA